jgi:predicted acyltransferase
MDAADAQGLTKAKPDISSPSVCAPKVSAAVTVPPAQFEEKERYLPLDAYRGLIMLLLISDGFGISSLPEGSPLHFIAYQFEHRPWGGAVFYDLIMPAFLFMVGVAMPFAIGRRLDRAEDRHTITKHVVARCLRLLMISQIILSIALNRPHLQFHNVLTQVAAAYLVCYFLMRLPFWQQAAAAAALLVAHSAIYLLFAGPDGAFAQVTNAGARLDRWLMGQNYPWPCVNLNILAEVPSVLFGVWAGNLLRQEKLRSAQLKTLALGMAAAFAVGLLISPIIPINKWLWTASYTLYTTGWAILGLLLCIVLVEYAELRRPLFPLMVVGMNSLFIYCIHQLLKGWVDHSLTVFTGGYKVFGSFGAVMQSCSVLAVFWLLAYWMYKRKIFLKV